MLITRATIYDEFTQSAICILAPPSEFARRTKGGRSLQKLGTLRYSVSLEIDLKLLSKQIFLNSVWSQRTRSLTQAASHLITSPASAIVLFQQKLIATDQRIFFNKINFPARSSIRDSMVNANYAVDGTFRCRTRQTTLRSHYSERKETIHHWTKLILARHNFGIDGAQGSSLVLRFVLVLVLCFVNI